MGKTKLKRRITHSPHIRIRPSSDRRRRIASRSESTSLNRDGPSVTTTTTMLDQTDEETLYRSLCTVPESVLTRAIQASLTRFYSPVTKKKKWRKNKLKITIKTFEVEEAALVKKAVGKARKHYGENQSELNDCFEQIQKDCRTFRLNPQQSERKDFISFVDHVSSIRLREYIKKLKTGKNGEILEADFTDSDAPPDHRGNDNKITPEELLLEKSTSLQKIIPDDIVQQLDLPTHSENEMQVKLLYKDSNYCKIDYEEFILRSEEFYFPWSPLNCELIYSVFIEFIKQLSFLHQKKQYEDEQKSTGQAKVKPRPSMKSIKTHHNICKYRYVEYIHKLNTATGTNGQFLVALITAYGTDATKYPNKVFEFLSERDLLKEIEEGEGETLKELITPIVSTTQSEKVITETGKSSSSGEVPNSPTQGSGEKALEGQGEVMGNIFSKVKESHKSPGGDGSTKVPQNSAQNTFGTSPISNKPVKSTAQLFNKSKPTTPQVKSKQLSVPIEIDLTEDQPETETPTKIAENAKAQDQSANSNLPSPHIASKATSASTVPGSVVVVHESHPPTPSARKRDDDRSLLSGITTTTSPIPISAVSQTDCPPTKSNTQINSASSQTNSSQRAPTAAVPVQPKPKPLAQISPASPARKTIPPAAPYISLRDAPAKPITGQTRVLPTAPVNKSVPSKSLPSLPATTLSSQDKTIPPVTPVSCAPSPTANSSVAPSHRKTTSSTHVPHAGKTAVPSAAPTSATSSMTDQSKSRVPASSSTSAQIKITSSNSIPTPAQLRAPVPARLGAPLARTGTALPNSSCLASNKSPPSNTQHNYNSTSNQSNPQSPNKLPARPAPAYISLNSKPRLPVPPTRQQPPTAQPNIPNISAHTPQKPIAGNGPTNQTRSSNQNKETRMAGAVAQRISPNNASAAPKQTENANTHKPSQPEKSATTGINQNQPPRKTAPSASAVASVGQTRSISVSGAAPGSNANVSSTSKSAVANAVPAGNQPSRAAPKESITPTAASEIAKIVTTAKPPLQPPAQVSNALAAESSTTTVDENDANAVGRKCKKAIQAIKKWYGHTSVPSEPEDSFGQKLVAHMIEYKERICECRDQIVKDHRLEMIIIPKQAFVADSGRVGLPRVSRQARMKSGNTSLQKALVDPTNGGQWYQSQNKDYDGWDPFHAPLPYQVFMKHFIMNPVVNEESESLYDPEICKLRYIEYMFNVKLSSRQFLVAVFTAYDSNIETYPLRVIQLLQRRRLLNPSSPFMQDDQGPVTRIYSDIEDDGTEVLWNKPEHPIQSTSKKRAGEADPGPVAKKKRDDVDGVPEFYEIPFDAWKYACKKILAAIQKASTNPSSVQPLQDEGYRKLYAQYLCHVETNFEKFVQGILTAYPGQHIPDSIRSMFHRINKDKLRDQRRDEGNEPVQSTSSNHYLADKESLQNEDGEAPIVIDYQHGQGGGVVVDDPVTGRYQRPDRKRLNN